MILKTLSACLLLVVVAGCAVPRCFAAPVQADGKQPVRLELVELPARAAAQDLPAIPWVAAGDDSWQGGEPLIRIAMEGVDTTAEGWAAVSAEAILLKVVVHDDVHFQDRRGGDIWDGDGLQIGVDALGDGSGGAPAETWMVGPDDAELAVALTGDHSTVWAHHHGRPGGVGQLPHDYARIARDEDGKTTTYGIALPWAEFGVLAGASPVLGLRVQVNDTDGEGRVGVVWNGRSNRCRPGLFDRVALSRPPAEYAAAGQPRMAIYRASDAGQIAFCVASDRPLHVRARVGDLERDLPLRRASFEDGVRSFAVRATLGELPAEPIPFAAELVADGDEALAAADGLLHAPVRIVEALHDRAEELAAHSPHPLFTRHLRSLQALVKGEWNRAMMVVDDQPTTAAQVAADAEDILAGMNADAGQWETYRRSDRPLVLARVMSDGSLQHSLLTLPRDWDPDREYPLIVSLHGAGPSRKLAYVQMGLAPRQEQPGESQPGVLPGHFTLGPWGRGNRGYEEWAEDDVWEAMDELRRGLKIDEDRISLTGHSMGGAGAWALGLRAPDVWAAVCPVAGGTWSVPGGIGIGRNAAHLPVRIWHGDADGAVPVENAHTMEAELRRHGNQPEMVIVPGQGHDYPAEAQAENARWLLQHVRRRPDRFQYICDTDRHRGVWGIWMERDLSVDPLPRFDCRIEGDTVRISSHGTPGMYVELGEGGLGLEGDVVVYWNDEKAYEGPPEEITLGTGGGWRP